MPYYAPVKLLEVSKFEPFSASFERKRMCQNQLFFVQLKRNDKKVLCLQRRNRNYIFV